MIEISKKKICKLYKIKHLFFIKKKIVYVHDQRPQRPLGKIPNIGIYRLVNIHNWYTEGSLCTYKIMTFFFFNYRHLERKEKKKKSMYKIYIITTVHFFLRVYLYYYLQCNMCIF